MVIRMITGCILHRRLLQNVVPTLANQIAASANASIRNSASCLRMLCYHEINRLQTYTNDAGSLEIRKYLYATGIDCTSLAKHVNCYRTVLCKDKVTIQALIHTLEHQGYCKNDIIELIRKVPQVLTLEPEELQERIESFISIGFTTQDLLASEYRSLAFTDYFFVTKSIIYVMRELLDATDNWLCSLMKYKSVVFKELKAEDVHANIVLLKKLLLQHGCSENDVKKVLLQVIRNDYRLLRTDESHVVTIVEFFAEKGISGQDFIFVFRKSSNIFQFTPEQLEQRMHYLKIMLEMSETDVRKLVIRYPRALGMKKDNLDEHIDCFAQMGIDVSYIRTNPFVLWVRVNEIKRRFSEMEDAGIFSEPVTPSKIRTSFSHLNSSKIVFEKNMNNHKRSKLENSEVEVTGS